MHPSSILDRLRALDERTLADVVRQDQRCPSFVLTSWRVERLSDKGIVNPEGLFRFSGMGCDPSQQEDVRAWSVVLKILRAPEEEGAITNIWYWKRELLAFQSGLLDELPAGGVKAPRFYGAVEQEGEAWIWMEYIQEKAPPLWPLRRFAETALRLGRLDGLSLVGRPLPDFPWLSRGQGITWAVGANLDELWGHPIFQRLFSDKDLPRLRRLWKERERFFRAYHDLPQVFAHGDATRRNQLYRMTADGEEELVSIDWAWSGIAPLGWDLSMLLMDSTLLFDLDAGLLARAEEAAFPAYLEGLRAAGWQGDSRLARLGFCVSATVFPLLPGPRACLDWSGEDMRAFTLQTFGRSFAEAVPGWRALFAYLLDLGEEALSLLDEMALGPAA